MITLKRLVIGTHWTNLKPKVYIFLSPSIKNKQNPEPFRINDEKYSNEVVDVNKSFEWGPVKKDQASITISVFNDRALDVSPAHGLRLSGNIYDLWKNGNKIPEDSEEFIDIVFSWRNAPK